MGQEVIPNMDFTYLNSTQLIMCLVVVDYLGLSNTWLVSHQKKPKNYGATTKVNFLITNYFLAVCSGVSFPSIPPIAGAYQPNFLNFTRRNLLSFFL